MTEQAKPQPKLPPTHDSHPASTRVLEENQNDLDQLRDKLAGLCSDVSVQFKQTVIKTDVANVTAALSILKTDAELNFTMLTDITAVDNLRRTDFDPVRRFTVIHTVYSVERRKRVRLETDLSENSPRIHTAAGVYKGAAWIEREVYDMFGIEFDGHPDLRRVLLPDYYEHFPLRKEYPLTGRGERDNFIRAEEVD
jgi:NADH-quinone oxidoreductase subunit C